MRRSFTEEQEAWIRREFNSVDSYAELTDRFNETFGERVTVCAMSQRCSKSLGLTGMNKNVFTREQEEWIRCNYYVTDSYQVLTDKFNEQFGTERNVDTMREKCTKRMKLSGMPNPSQYGVKAKEQLPIGTIRKSQTGTYIKVKEVPNVAHRTCLSGYQEPYWMPLQKKVYQDAHGEIKSNQMVCFLDGNPENFELDNLYPIDRKIAAVMSSNRWWTESREHTLTAIKWCELLYAIKGLERTRDERPIVE